jgi:signal transduction histidine kinase
MLRSPGLLSLNPVFEETLPEVAARAVAKGLSFRQRIEPNLPPIVGQHEAFRLILVILLDNAIKFTPSGGVQVSAWSEDGSVLVEIRDDGIGIPAESIAHVFKRFYRTQLAVERGLAGSGLGLYVVKESLDYYNGRITVQSTIGKGAVFTIRLPVAET